jgi:hypothetical protein
MPSRPARPAARPAGAANAIALPGATIHLQNVEWFRPLAPNVRLAAGMLAPEMLRIPVAAANSVLRSIIHLVADIRADSPPTVVWTLGANELLVLLDRTQLVCAPGFVTFRFVVACEQLRDAQRVDVAFGVGSKARATGLVMSSFDRVQGNAIIADTWSAAITAFAWEALITVAQQLAGAVGKDSRGRPLVAGSIAADANVLMIGPMARHDLRLADER